MIFDNKLQSTQERVTELMNELQSTQESATELMIECLESKAKMAYKNGSNSFEFFYFPLFEADVPIVERLKIETFLKQSGYRWNWNPLPIGSICVYTD